LDLSTAELRLTACSCRRDQRGCGHTVMSKIDEYRDWKYGRDGVMER
jgi:hypothetical protein